MAETGQIEKKSLNEQKEFKELFKVPHGEKIFFYVNSHLVQKCQYFLN
ncbi:MAG: hypothetical protein ABFS43_00755 [Thermodesulfobacteriota bacterium]